MALSDDLKSILNKQFNIAGPSYVHTTYDLNAQRSINLYPVLNQDATQSTLNNNRAEGALINTPGLISSASDAGNEVRALIATTNYVYAIIDNTIYKYTYNKTNNTLSGSSIGTIEYENENISVSKNTSQIFIANGTKSYVVDIATDDVTLISSVDADFISANDVTYIDGYFFYSEEGTQRIYSTAIEDGLDIDGLDTAVAHSRTDNVVGIAAHKHELWVFGEDSIELWFNAANEVGFPFSRRDDIAIMRGCAARDSIVLVNEELMWLDEKGFVVRSTGYQAQVVSTEPITKEIQSFNKIDDAKGFTISVQGHYWYVLSFPEAQRTFVYDLNTGMWFEWMYWNPGTAQFEAHLGARAVYHKQNYLLGSRLDGQVFTVDSNTYTDAGDTIRRERTCKHIGNGIDILSVHALAGRVETGTALATGQGSNPTINLQVSRDGGHTYGAELSRTLGEVGSYGGYVRWNRLGTARDFTFKFSMSDPVPYRLLDFTLDPKGYGNGL